MFLSGEFKTSFQDSMTCKISYLNSSISMEVNDNNYMVNTVSFWWGRLVHMSIKAHIVVSYCFVIQAHTLTAGFVFYKSIIQKSHLVWQTALNKNTTAQWILLISLCLEHSCSWETAHELGHFLIPCLSFRGNLRIRWKTQRKSNDTMSSQCKIFLTL